MKIGFYGLGKMGANMVERLLLHNQEVVAFNRTKEKVDEAVKKGAVGAASIEDMITKLPERKVVWLMLPAGAVTDIAIEELISLLKPGDIIIDGANSFWRDTQKRNEIFRLREINFVDCGVSGGIWGLKNGYCLMYGGENEPVEYLLPILQSLAAENGYLHCGKNGAGHFVKMVHNGIEYGMMQAYAEGFEIMEKSPFNIDLAAVSKVWQHGSVVVSWLLELASLALLQDPKLEQIKGFVNDSGEGRWTIQTAIDFDVPAHVISASLFTRFQSRQEDSFAMKLLAALRNQFGGHELLKVKDEKKER